MIPSTIATKGTKSTLSLKQVAKYFLFFSCLAVENRAAMGHVTIDMASVSTQISNNASVSHCHTPFKSAISLHLWFHCDTTITDSGRGHLGEADDTWWLTHHKIDLLLYKSKQYLAIRRTVTQDETFGAAACWTGLLQLLLNLDSGCSGDALIAPSFRSFSF